MARKEMVHSSWIFFFLLLIAAAMVGGFSFLYSPVSSLRGSTTEPVPEYRDEGLTGPREPVSYSTREFEGDGLLWEDSLGDWVCVLITSEGQIQRVIFGLDSPLPRHVDGRLQLTTRDGSTIEIPGDAPRRVHILRAHGFESLDTPLMEVASVVRALPDEKRSVKDAVEDMELDSRR